jgi:hypothetical protein
VKVARLAAFIIGAAVRICDFGDYVGPGQTSEVFYVFTFAFAQVRLVTSSGYAGIKERSGRQCGAEHCSNPPLFYHRANSRILLSGLGIYRYRPRSARQPDSIKFPNLILLLILTWLKNVAMR